MREMSSMMVLRLVSVRPLQMLYALADAYTLGADYQP